MMNKILSVELKFYFKLFSKPYNVHLALASFKVLGS